MNRTIRFRVWDSELKNFEDSHENWSHEEYELFLPPRSLLKSALDLLDESRYTIEQFTGLTDSQGREIYEGDILLASEARYEMTLAESSGGSGPSIYVVDHDKPLPAPDVPWFKAVVEWNESMCGFWLRYLGKRADWGPGISTALNDKHYTYTVVGNVHETPITSSGSTS